MTEDGWAALPVTVPCTAGDGEGDEGSTFRVWTLARLLACDWGSDVPGPRRDTVRVPATQGHREHQVRQAVWELCLLFSGKERVTGDSNGSQVPWWVLMAPEGTIRCVRSQAQEACGLLGREGTMSKSPCSSVPSESPPGCLRHWAWDVPIQPLAAHCRSEPGSAGSCPALPAPVQVSGRCSACA